MTRARMAGSIFKPLLLESCLTWAYSSAVRRSVSCFTLLRFNVPTSTKLFFCAFDRGMYADLMAHSGIPVFRMMMLDTLVNGMFVLCPAHSVRGTEYTAIQQLPYYDRSIAIFLKATPSAKRKATVPCSGQEQRREFRVDHDAAMTGGADGENAGGNLLAILDASPRGDFRRKYHIPVHFFLLN